MVLQIGINNKLTEVIIEYMQKNINRVMVHYLLMCLKAFFYLDLLNEKQFEEEFVD